PTPDTQVRVACAWAIDAKANVKIAIANTLIVNRNLFIWSLLFSFLKFGWPPVEHGSVPATVAPSLPIVAEKHISYQANLEILKQASRLALRSGSVSCRALPSSFRDQELTSTDRSCSQAHSERDRPN